MQKKSVFACLAGGAAVGAANGLFGGGGGMLAVPILEKAGLEERCAHATAIAVIAPASLVSGIVYLCSGLVEMPLFIPAALGVLLGGLLGAKLLRILPLGAISLLFEGVMLAAGLRLLFP